MIEAGEVGAILKIVDEASPTLKRIAAQLNELQAALDRTKLAMAEIKFPPGLNRSIGSFSEKLAGVGGAADTAAAGVKTAFGSMDASILATQERVAALAKDIATVGAESRAAVGNMGLRARGSGAARSPSGRSAAEQSALGDMGNFAEGAGLGAAAKTPAFIAGAIAAGAGYEAFTKGADLEAVENRLRMQGVTEAAIKQATKIAFDVGGHYALTAAGVLSSMSEIMNPLNKGTTPDEGMKAAEAHIGTLAAAMTVLQGLDSKKGTDTAKQAYDLVKSAEFRNAIGEQQFDAAVGAMVKASEATGGVVTPADWFKGSKYLRSALPRLSDRFLYTMFPELSQEFGGSSGGTALSAVYQQIVAGQMRTTGLRLLDTLGEIDESKAEFDKNGRIVRIKPGANKLGDLFATDPDQYAARIVADLKAHGITAEQDQRDWLSQIFGNRNSAQMMMTLA